MIIFGVYHTVDIWFFKSIPRRMKMIRLPILLNLLCNVRKPYFFDGIWTTQEGLILDALDDVTIFQSHPAISPHVPVIRKWLVAIILCTCWSAWALNWYVGPNISSFSPCRGPKAMVRLLRKKKSVIRSNMDKTLILSQVRIRNYTYSYTETSPYIFPAIKYRPSGEKVWLNTML